VLLTELRVVVVELDLQAEMLPLLAVQAKAVTVYRLLLVELLHITLAVAVHKLQLGMLQVV
jgi:hypothetical protein